MVGFVFGKEMEEKWLVDTAAEFALGADRIGNFFPLVGDSIMDPRNCLRSVARRV
jgi:hypothetical protein